MAQQTINVGTSPNDGLGDPIRTAFTKCNDNFSELYSRAQVTPPTTLVGSVGDEAGMYAYDSAYFYYCFQDYDGSSIIWAQVTQIGNITVPQITNGTSNVDIDAGGGPVTVGVGGTANVMVITSTAANITVDLNVTGNSEFTGDITAGNILPAANATYDLGSAGSQWNDLYLSGNTIYLGDAEITATANSISFITGTGTEFVVGGSSGNADGNFSNVSATGNVTAANLVASGAITANSFALNGNANITGNVVVSEAVSVVGNITTDAYFIGTFVGNVTGNFVVPGSNTWVLYNTNGNADASSDFTFNAATKVLTVDGVASATGNVVGGNLRTGGVIYSLGSITSESTISAGGTVTGTTFVGTQTSVTGNVTGGNIFTGGVISATGNVTGGNIIGTIATASQTNITSVGTLSSLSVTGNVSAGNLSGSSVTGTLTTAAQPYITSVGSLTSLTVTGNITGNRVFGGQEVNATLYTGTTVSASGNVTGANLVTGGTITSTGNITGGNILTGGRVSATGNVTGTTFVGAVASSTTISATGNVTGGNILTGGRVSATGNVTGTTFVGAVSSGTTVSATGNVIGGNILTGGLISATGNVTAGNISIAGIITVNSNGGGTAIYNGGSNAVGNIGTSSNYFNTVFATATTALYADLAESYLADDAYEPGTVVSFGGQQEITQTQIDSDPAVAGVVSGAPAYAMNSGLTGDHVCKVALTGRVPCRVIGPVNKGSLMVSAGFGAARAEINPAPGTIIGKSLQDFKGDQGTIEIVVGRF